MNKQQLCEALILAIKGYMNLEKVYFVYAKGRGGVDVRVSSLAENKFVFNVLLNGALYRAVYKDGYMQVIERLFQDLDSGIVEMPDDKTCERICELVEVWFSGTETLAWWKVKESYF